MKFVVSVILFLSVGFAYAGSNYLFFDTETTGLPHDYEAPAFDTLNWPRMVQLSWILTDNKGNVLSTHDYIIRPDGYEIPEKSASIHGISTEKAMLEGLPLDSVLVVFVATLDSAEYIVGHNISFDIHVVDAEFFRRGVDVQLSSMKSYCTMLAGTDYCKLPGRYGHYKWPKLQELHKILLEATCKCFWEMRRRKII